MSKNPCQQISLSLNSQTVSEAFCVNTMNLSNIASFMSVKEGATCIPKRIIEVAAVLEKRGLGQGKSEKGLVFCLSFHLYIRHAQ